MCTERQRLANQENARKSTGPKTTEGKENSRRNALKHGLTGSGEVLNRTDARRLKKELKAWTAHLQPIDVLEDCLVRRAALASVRLKRCLKKDLADLARRKHRATKRWDVRQQKAVDECVELLETDPKKAVTQFEATSHGCDWLIDHWKELAAALDEPGFWDDAQARLAIRMLGKDPATTPMDDASLTKLRLAILAVSPELEPDEVDAFFEVSTADLDPDARTEALNQRLPDRATGRAMLLDITEQELARLEPLGEQLWEAQDEPARQEAEDRSLVDTSLAGARSLRYESAHEMSVHRSVNLIIRLRKVESEQQTYNRFSKMGIDQGRRFNGANWEFVRDEAKAQKREEQERRDYERIAAEAPDTTDLAGPERAGQMSAQERYEAHRVKLAAEQGTHDAESGGSDEPIGAPATAEPPVRNEAKYADANQQCDTVYDAPVEGSQSLNDAGSERARAKVVGAEPARPKPSKTVFDEQTAPPRVLSGEQTVAPGALRNEPGVSDANHSSETVCDRSMAGVADARGHA